MISLKKRSDGFTIIELLIVIAVIGILVLLIAGTHSDIQAKTRNNERSEDVDTVHNQLEIFFSRTSYYPSLRDINDSKWLRANMKTLDTDALIDPANPQQSKTLVAAPIAKSYAYAPKDSSGKSCEADETTCVQYALTATYEGTVSGATTIVRNNLD